MKCPACFNQVTEMQVGSLVVDVCDGGCGGIWFDVFDGSSFSLALKASMSEPAQEQDPWVLALLRPVESKDLVGPNARVSIGAESAGNVRK